MKLTVLQENLNRAILIASRFVSPRAQLPVLGNIKLEAQKNKLIVSSTNLEVSVSVVVGSQIEEEGVITIPGKIITEIISNLQTGTINLEAAKEQLKISSQNFTSSVLGMNASDFPSIPQKVDTKKAFTLPKDQFLDGLNQSLFATSIDETRPILTGVLMIPKKDSLILVATDGFRLSQKKLAIKGIEKITNVVLPKGGLTELSRLSDGIESFLLDFKPADKQVIFALGDTILSSRVLEGEYPDYEKIIPTESLTKVWLDKEELLRSIKLASVFARESANIVKLTISKDLTVSAEGQTSGNQRTKLEAKVEGKPLEIAYNYRFLEDFLRVVKGEDILMEFSNSNAPGIFVDPQDNNYLHLIMPVKIQT